MAEEIQIRFAQDDAFFAEADRRFSDLARKAAADLTSAFKNAGAFGAGGAAGSTPGGGGGGGGGLRGAVTSAAGDFGPAAGALFSVGAQTLGGVSAGIRGVRGEAASSGRVLADQAISGGLSSFVEGTVGKIPVLGDILVAQMNAAKDAIEIPRDRATSRLQGIYGNLARGGYEASDDEINKALSFQNELEQRSYKAEQRIDRLNREQHPTSAAFGIAWNGS